MNKIRQVWIVAGFQFRQWKKNPRIFLIGVLAMLLCLMLSDKIVSFVGTYRTSVQLFEPFIWIFGDGSSIMLSSVLLILLFADAPFIDMGTPYSLVRTDRTRWIGGQLLYIFLTVLIYTAFLFLMTCLLCAPYAFVGNKWSETGAMLGYSGVGAQIALPASVKAMELTRPYACAGMIFLLMALYGTLTATWILLLNLYGSRFWGVLGAFLFSAYGLMLNPQIFTRLLKLPEALTYKANTAAGWLSPLNHATYYMHNFGYDHLPRLWMSVLVFLVFIGLNLVFIRKKIENYEFNFAQRNA